MGFFLLNTWNPRCWSVWSEIFEIYSKFKLMTGLKNGAFPLTLPKLNALPFPMK